MKTGDTDFYISESSYSNFSNHHVNFTFSLPRTDLCNICFIYDATGKNKEEYERHLGKVKMHSTMKNAVLALKDTLQGEFDFGQNKACPWLPVNAQFYARLLWWQILNFHVHGTGENGKDRSYMYHFLEGSLKNGANTVFNFVYHAICEELKRQSFNRICLYSDSAGGQNKCYLTMMCLSLLSKHTCKWKSDIYTPFVGTACASVIGTFWAVH